MCRDLPVTRRHFLDAAAACVVAAAVREAHAQPTPAAKPAPAPAGKSAPVPAQQQPPQQHSNNGHPSRPLEPKHASG